jgi:hypothetical protein
MGPPMTFRRSGEPSVSRLERARLLAAAAATALCAASALGVIGGCADRVGAASGTSPACSRGLPECPIEVAFTPGIDADVAVLEGTLSSSRSSFSYAFVVKAGTRLQWNFSGPAVHVVLTYPDGNVDGPGLSRNLALPIEGRYVFSVSSNLMAEEVYGPFRLELRRRTSESESR